MTDWATEIETEILDRAWGRAPGKPLILHGDIAKILRKSKADGMREAAAWCASQGDQWAKVLGCDLEEGIQKASAAILQAQADKMEKGEPND